MTLDFQTQRLNRMDQDTCSQYSSKVFVWCGQSQLHVPALLHFVGKCFTCAPHLLHKFSSDIR